MIRRLFPIAVLIAMLPLPAMADEAIHPTRFFDRLNGTPGYIRVPGVEEATTLAPGTLLIDTAINPAFGFSYGLLPNLEVGANVNGSTQFKVVSGKYQGMESSNAGLGFLGKYHVLSRGGYQVALLGEVGYGYNQVARQLGFQYGNTWMGYIGLPLSYYQEGYSLHAMPIAELGSSGGLSAPPGISLGARLRLNPFLWLLVGDYLGLGGFTQTFSSGLRYEPASWGAFDIKLVDYMYNTGSPGLRIGSFGVTAYFGGSK